MTTLATLTAWETSLFSAPARPAARPAIDSSTAGTPGAATVDDLVDEARSTYERVSARAAYQLVLFRRAVLVDIRPEAQRRAEGEVHPALGPVLVERNVLE